MKEPRKSCCNKDLGTLNYIIEAFRRQLQPVKLMVTRGQGEGEERDEREGREGKGREGRGT